MNATYVSQFSIFSFHKIARKLIKNEINQSKIGKNIACLTFKLNKQFRSICSLEIALDSVKFVVLLAKF